MNPTFVNKTKCQLIVGENTCCGFRMMNVHAFVLKTKSQLIIYICYVDSSFCQSQALPIHFTKVGVLTPLNHISNIMKCQKWA